MAALHKVPRNKNMMCLTIQGMPDSRLFDYQKFTKETKKIIRLETQMPKYQYLEGPLEVILN